MATKTNVTTHGSKDSKATAHMRPNSGTGNGPVKQLAKANAAKAAPPKAPKTSKAPDADTAPDADRKPAYAALPDGAADALTVRLLVDGNPKRGKSAARWDLYKDGMTVAAALDAGVLRADLRWDLAHGLIAVNAGGAAKVSKTKGADKRASK